MLDLKSFRLLSTAVALLGGSGALAEESGVDTFISSIKFGCLPIIKDGASVENIVIKFGGGPLIDRAADVFLRGRTGVAYGLRHSDHHFVMAVFTGISACTVFVRRIDKVEADRKLTATLTQSGFALIAPAKIQNNLQTAAYSQNFGGKNIGVVTSFSTISDGMFDVAVTVHKTAASSAQPK